MATFNGTTGLDFFLGLAGQDNTFVFEKNELQNQDTVVGNSLEDTIDFFGQGPFVQNAASWANVSHIEFILVHQTNAHDTTLIIPNALVASSDYAGMANKDALTITLGPGDDTVNLSAVLSGSSISVDFDDGDDSIIGGGADADYLGGAGRDDLVAGAGAEYFHGEGDSDTVVATAAHADGDIYAAGDGSSPFNFNETITLTTAGVFAFTMGGFETVTLANGANDGDIELAVFFQSITLNGGSGDDTVTMIDPDRDQDIGSGIFGMFMNGRGGDDQLYGTLKEDELFGGNGVDILDGKDGDDRLTGGGAGDLMYGGDGDDRFLDVGSGDLIVELTDGGYDTMETALSVAGMPAHVELLQFTGNTAAELTGNNGDNRIISGSHADTLRGAEGDDVIFGGAGKDTISGQQNDDILWGDAGYDTLDGGRGDDLLNPGGGNNTLRGAQGFDTADYSQAVAALDINMDRADEVMVAGHVDQLASIERIRGSQYNDVFASSAPNAIVFEGNIGFDTIDYHTVTQGFISNGGEQTEHIIAGSGNDSLFYYVWAEGGLGDDELANTTAFDGQTFDGGDGIDTVIYTLNPASVPPETLHVDLLDNSLNAGWAFDDILIGIENLHGSGENDDEFYGDGADNLFYGGEGGHNILDGRDGNDTLIGGQDLDEMFGEVGDDTLFGYAGPDLMYGGDGVDTASYKDSPAGVTVTLITQGGFSVGQGFGGDAEGDYLETIEDITGSSFRDHLTGDNARNHLSGSGGADVLTGGRSRDALDGDAGADDFVYLSVLDSDVGSGHDTIMDFSQAQLDQVDLSAIDAENGGSDNAFHFTAAGGTGAFTGDAGELRFFADSGNTLVQGDTDGDGNGDFEIALIGAYTLGIADFIF